VDDKHNQFFLFFSFFNKKFKSGNRLMDLFSDHFSFHFYSSNTKKHIEKLDEIVPRALSNPSLTIIVSDTSIKNHVTTLILHIHSYNKSVVKTIHRAINITTTEAELFVIHCGINQAVANSDISHIVIITNSLHVKIVDGGLYFIFPFHFYFTFLFFFF